MQKKRGEFLKRYFLKLEVAKSEEGVPEKILFEAEKKRGEFKILLQRLAIIW